MPGVGPTTPGTAMLVGTNNAIDVAPLEYQDTAPYFTYPHYFCQAAMEIYGSGAFVADYGTAGAFAVAATGGHKGNPVYGVLTFDFATFTWSYKRNSNGFTETPTFLTQSQMSSVGEILGVSNPMPAPAHLYRFPMGLSKADGGGTSGSLIIPVGMYADDHALISWDYAYQIDLATGFWTRSTSNTHSSTGSNVNHREGWAVYDPTTKRIYTGGDIIAGVTSLPYIDLGKKMWNAIPRTGSDLNGQYQKSVFIDPVRNLLVMKVGTSPDPSNPNPPAPFLGAIDLSTGNGPTPLPTPAGTVFPSHDNRFDYYPADGCWYSYSGDGTNVIDKLAPPNTPSNATSTWVYSKVTIGGASLSPQQNDSGANNAHYTRFFYVPQLQCFAWVAGGFTPVALIKP
jgi:hypothetical protein